MSAKKIQKIKMNKVSHEKTKKYILKSLKPHNSTIKPKILIEKNAVSVGPVFKTKKEEPRFARVMAMHASSDARLD